MQREMEEFGLKSHLFLEIFEEIPQVKGFFSTKQGASAGSPYYNEEVLKEAGLLDMQLIWPGQVHKDEISVIKERGTEPVSIPDTDGLITDVPGVLLTTVHADCLPVWFYDPEHNAAGLVHAGWRGTAAGIAAKAVRMMEKHYGSSPEAMQCVIGPGISACCFEVGPEVYEAFKESWDFTDSFSRPVGEKYFLDIKGINRQQLLELGVKEAHMRVSSHCTCCEPEQFCSYRREGGTYMRMGAGLCLLP